MEPAAVNPSGPDEEPEAAARRACSRVFLGVALACSILHLLIQLAYSPKVLLEVFHARATPMPLISVLALHPLFVWLAPALAVAGIAKEVLIANKAVTLRLNALHILILFALGGLHGAAVLLPLYAGGAGVP